MGTIKIQRPWGNFGVIRRLKVWIDDTHVGNVRTNKSEVFEVSEAPHSVQVSMDWCKSAPCRVDLSNGGSIELVARTISFPASLFLAFWRPSVVFYVEPGNTSDKSA